MNMRRFGEKNIVTLQEELDHLEIKINEFKDTLYKELKVEIILNKLTEYLNNFLSLYNNKK